MPRSPFGDFANLGTLTAQESRLPAPGSLLFDIFSSTVGNKPSRFASNNCITNGDKILLINLL